MNTYGRLRTKLGMLALMALLALGFTTSPASAQERRESRGATHSNSRVERKKLDHEVTTAKRPKKERKQTQETRSGNGNRRSDAPRGVQRKKGKKAERTHGEERNERGRARTEDRRKQTEVRRSKEVVERGRRSVLVEDRRVKRHRPSPLPPYRKKKYRPNTVVSPKLQVNIHWPWEFRYRRSWRPRYRYRQVVYVEVGWGGRHRRAHLDVQTYYRHTVRYATHEYAEIDIEIEAVEVYENGRFLGSVHHIPYELARIRATVFRDGSIRFDRDLFLLGDAYAGFEMVATRHVRANTYDAYARGEMIVAGRLDLRRERVYPLAYSRFYHPREFDGYVPITLLPEDRQWLYDYGFDAVSAYDREYEYFGREDYGDDYDGVTVVGGVGLSFQAEKTTGTAIARVPRRNTEDRNFRIEGGVEVRLKREMEIERVE